jgi:hypothetical protein
VLKLRPTEMHIRMRPVQKTTVFVNLEVSDLRFACADETNEFR